MRINNNLFIIFLVILVQAGTTIACHAQQVLESLSLEQKIGQLFMVAACANPDEPRKASQYTESEIMALIESFHIGGIIYLGHSDPEQQISMTRRLKDFNRKHSKLELWVGLDAEWGPQMRIHNTIKFPYNMTLGAIQDDGLICELGYMIGEQLKLLGVSINFAPVVDINTNPSNPVINKRSFGQDHKKVFKHAYAYASGLTKSGVMACIKHFPGHGDTDIDSHNGLPVINHDASRINNIELYPFKKLISKGIEAIMVGHLMLPVFDNQLPATMSRTLTTNLLKKHFYFDGLVVTDALDMHGVTDICEPGLIELNALLAGADLLLVPLDVPKAVATIKKALAEGKLSLEELDLHVLKIIKAKAAYAHHECSLPDQISAQLNSQQAQYLSKRLYQKAVTIVRNQCNSIPIKVKKEAVAVIVVGASDLANFADEFSEYKSVQVCRLSQIPSETELAQAKKLITNASRIVIGLSGLDYKVHDTFGMSKVALDFISELCEYKKQLILVLFGNPYACALFGAVNGLIVAYEDHQYAQQAAARVILGEVKAEGRLPIVL